MEYPVEFAPDAFAEDRPLLADTLKKATGAESPRVMIVADMNVVHHTEGLGAKIGRYFQAHGLQLAARPVVLPGGEKIKNDSLQSAMRLACDVLEAKIGAGDALVALGGGTVLDVAGWVAAQVRGGSRLVRMPTTPAAMVDAAFATYAGLDSRSVKDALRVPSVPAAVLIDTTFAGTVLDGVWRGGYAAALRLATVTDAALFKKVAAAAEAFKGRDLAALAETVEACVAVRRKKDPAGFAEWATLRLEAMSGYKLPHGYAIALGMLIDTAYAEKKGIFEADDRRKIVDALAASGALEGASHSRHLLGQADALLCGLDAYRLTTETGAVVLPKGLGKAEADDAPDREAMKAVLEQVKGEA